MLCQTWQPYNFESRIILSPLPSQWADFLPKVNLFPKNFLTNFAKILGPGKLEVRLNFLHFLPKNCQISANNVDQLFLIFQSDLYKTVYKRSSLFYLIFLQNKNVSNISKDSKFQWSKTRFNGQTIHFSELR